MPTEYQTLKVEGVTWGSLPNPSVIKTLLESGGNTTCKTINSAKISNSSKILSKWREIKITLTNTGKIKRHLIFSWVSVTKN